MNFIKKHKVISIAIVLSAMLMGCSDSGMDLPPAGPGFDLTAPRPIITVFKADPENVKAGEATTISWEVAGADTIEITSKSEGEAQLAFDIKTSELKGTAPVASLTSTTEFTITATKKPAVPLEGDVEAESKQTKMGQITVGGGKTEEEAPAADVAPAAPTESSVSQTITVVVEKSLEVSATVSVDKSTLATGERTIIRWEVTPAEAAVTIAGDDGVAVEPTFTGEDCTKTDTQELYEMGTPTEGPQATGCAVVEPSKTTTYTVTGTMASGETKSASIAVNIGTNQAKPSIMVNGESHAVVNSSTETVTVSWTVEPADAVVTVAADKSVTCTPELPIGKKSDGVTSAQCTLSSVPTTFTITAGEATDSADVSIGQVVAGIDIKASESWAFEGEEVSVQISLKQGSSASDVKEIQITDRKDGVRKIASAQTVSVSVPKGGVSVKMIDSTGKEHDYGTIVKSLDLHELSSDATYSAMAIDPKVNNERSYVGFKKSKFDGGKVRITINGATNKELSIPSLMAEPLFGKDETGTVKNFFVNESLENNIGPFSVNSITIRPAKSDELYVGVTGGILISEDAGNSFKALLPFIMTGKFEGDTVGSHNSCRGKFQKGGVSEGKGDIVGLSQICDIVVGGNGRLIAASDYGTVSVDNVDNLKLKKAKVVKSVALFKHVVEDLECVDVNCESVFAAANDGVYFSKNSGEAWEKFGDLGKYAYTLAIADGKVYAGTEDGVYESSSTAASWKQDSLSATKVLKLAIGQKKGSTGYLMLVGTDKGVYVSRNSGSSWSMIDATKGVESLGVIVNSNNSETSASFLVGNKTLYGYVTTYDVITPVSVTPIVQSKYIQMFSLIK